MGLNEDIFLPDGDAFEVVFETGNGMRALMCIGAILAVGGAAYIGLERRLSPRGKDLSLLGSRLYKQFTSRKLAVSWRFFAESSRLTMVRPCIN